MSYEISIGERKSLVFPVMCNSHLRIDYSDAIAGQDYGLFAHEDSISILAILTPYDINGFGYGLAQDNPTGKMGVVNSKKTPPTPQDHAFTLKQSDGSDYTINTTASTKMRTESHQYFQNYQDDTDGYEMVIFWNSHLVLSLIESTTTNINQPSEYKLKLWVKVDGVSDSITTSEAVITANTVTSDTFRFNQSSATITYGYDNLGGSASYEEIATVTGNTGTTTQLQTAGTENILFEDEENLYVRNGQIFTKVATVTSSTSSYVTVAYESGKGYSDVSSKMLYRETYKEALYLITPYHISATYDSVSGTMALYLNGARVASKQHSNAGEFFEIHSSDCFIGSDGDAALERDSFTSRQFMGELHEFAIVKGIQSNFSTLDTLIPPFKQTLLYYRFEEVDL